MAETNQLIDDLVAELQPLKPLPPTWVQWVAWAMVSLVTVAGFMLVVQPFRSGFWQDLRSPMFFIETFFSLASFASCSVVAYLLATPGQKVGRQGFLWALLPTLSFFGCLLYGSAFSAGAETSMVGKRPHCSLEVLVLSWVPISFLFFQLRRAYPYFLRKIALLVALAGTAIPVGLMQVACLHDPQHALQFHVVPAVLVTAFTVVIGRWALRPGRS